MEFSFSDRKWFLPEDVDPDAEGDEVVDFALGLHLRDSFDKVIDIKECKIQNPQGNLILSLIRDYVKDSGEPVYSQSSHKGFWRIAMLRYSLAHNEWMVNVVTSEERADLMDALSERLLHEVSNISTIVNNINKGKASVSYGEKEIVHYGSGYIHEMIGPFKFRISANSFFQTNSYMTPVLFEKIEEFGGLSGKETVLDLYSGTGTMSIFLSRRARQVTGIEISESAHNDALLNVRLNDVDNCKFILGDIKDGLRKLTTRPDIIVIDPPRAGINKKAMRIIMDMDVRRIVYISCNPSTMARDLSLLQDKYRIIKLQPIDMFPQTYHLESVTLLQLKNKALLQIS